MNAKRLEPDSAYEAFDTDGDGTVSDDELKTMSSIVEQSALLDKESSQRNICYIATWGMMLYPSLVVFSDFMELNQAAEILGAMSSIYYVSVAGLVSVWFGTKAWTRRNGK